MYHNAWAQGSQHAIKMIDSLIWKELKIPTHKSKDLTRLSCSLNSERERNKFDDIIKRVHLETGKNIRSGHGKLPF